MGRALIPRSFFCANNLGIRGKDKKMIGTIRERFEAKFIKGSGCWEWTASKGRQGYGQFKYNKRMQKAHRIAYQLYVGQIPDGLCVLHHCDNPSCVNPSHLFLGTDGDNARDRMNKGRGVCGEKVWTTKLTENDIRTIRKMRSDGVRQSDIAREFDVARPTISHIIRRRTWANL